MKIDIFITITNSWVLKTLVNSKAAMVKMCLGDWMIVIGRKLMGNK